MASEVPSYTTNLDQYLQRTNKGLPKATVKRTVKYLSVCNNPQAFRSVVRAAPDSVIKAIANAAFNVEQGDVHLTSGQKALFRKHRADIAKLTSKTKSIKRKRSVIQKGGFPFLPLLIGSALGAIGPKLFSLIQPSSQ